LHTFLNLFDPLLLLLSFYVSLLRCNPLHQTGFPCVTICCFFAVTYWLRGAFSGFSPTAIVCIDGRMTSLSCP
jgi:hypothetical protein